MTWTPEEEAAYLARRKRRNRVIGLLLLGFAVLFYGITVARMIK